MNHQMLTLTERLRQLRDSLLTGLIERDVTIRLALIGALSGEHLLLIGPPGTAKSHVARRLRQAFSESTYFERLLTRFSVPEELFGPLSIKGLEDDRYERLTDKYLPTASIAFLDEIFKANSAILNALLTLLNEREFDNGTQRSRVPLVAVIGASNELPECEELDALFDRFLLRLHVGPVTQEGFKDLLSLRGDSTPEIAPHLKLTNEDLRNVKAAAEGVSLPDDIVALLSSLREWCVAESIPVSDRRWRKIVKLLQVSAMTNGHDVVSIWDCWLLQHCLWSNPEDKEKIYQWYADRVGASAAINPESLTKIVVAWEGKLVSDEQSKSQVRNPDGLPMFKPKGGEATTASRHSVQARRGNEPLFLSPEGIEDDRGRRITDRTNGGKGYVYSELENMHILDRGRSSWRNFTNWSGREAYLSNPANHLLEEQDTPPLMEPTRHKLVYINDCISNIAELLSDIEKYQMHLNEHIQSLAIRVRTHLWLTPDFEAPATKSLEATAYIVQCLRERTERLRTGFLALPQEPSATTSPSHGGKKSSATELHSKQSKTFSEAIQVAQSRAVKA